MAGLFSLDLFGRPGQNAKMGFSCFRPHRPRLEPAGDHEKAELVKLRYFAGLTIEEAARLLNISEPTAKRWWAYARAWLFREINSCPS